MPCGNTRSAMQCNGLLCMSLGAHHAQCKAEASRSRDGLHMISVAHRRRSSNWKPARESSCLVPCGLPRARTVSHSVDPPQSLTSYSGEDDGLACLILLQRYPQNLMDSSSDWKPAREKLLSRVLWLAKDTDNQPFSRSAPVVYELFRGGRRSCTSDIAPKTFTNPDGVKIFAWQKPLPSSRAARLITIGHCE